MNWEACFVVVRGVQWPQAQLLNGLSFLHGISFPLPTNPLGICVGLFLGSGLCPTDLCVYSLCQSGAVLITVKI